MSTDNLVKGNVFLNSNAGQANIQNQINLESDSIAQSRFRRNKLEQGLFEANNAGGITYSKNKIAGEYEHLGSRFDQVVSSIGNKKGRTDHLEEMQKIRSDKAGLDAMSDSNAFTRYKRTSLGIDSAMQEAAAVGHGGGISGSMQFKGSIGEGFAAAGAKQHLTRALQFGTGYGMGHDMLNSIGIITKHQKNILQSKNIGKLGKVMTAGGVASGALYSASIAGDYLSGRKESTITDNAVTGIAAAALSIGVGTQAFRVSKEMTHAATSLIPKGITKNYSGPAAGAVKTIAKARPFAKFATGAAVGAGAFLATTALVDAGTSILAGAASMDNSVNRLKSKVYRGDYTASTDVNTNQLQTSRQRTLNKLSKSGLNDRATLLGNEAMVLKGLL